MGFRNQAAANKLLQLQQLGAILPVCRLIGNRLPAKTTVVKNTAPSRRGIFLLTNTLYKVYSINMSGKDLVKKLLKDGWVLDRVSGSHHIMRKNGVILSVPVHKNEDLKPGILNSFNKKAGYK
jgi:predicted RNA binding protein YcfA (HicA-like mRNA interferase family)